MYSENVDARVGSLVEKYNSIISLANKKMEVYSRLISELDKSVNDFMHELEVESFSDFEEQVEILRRLKVAVVERRTTKDEMQKMRCIEKMDVIKGFNCQNKPVQEDLFTEIGEIEKDIKDILDTHRLNFKQISALNKIQAEIERAYSKLKDVCEIHRTRKYEKRSSLPKEYFEKELAMSF
jgi:hypothetical protein